MKWGKHGFKDLLGAVTGVKAVCTEDIWRCRVGEFWMFVEQRCQIKASGATFRLVFLKMIFRDQMLKSVNIFLYYEYKLQPRIPWKDACRSSPLMPKLTDNFIQFWRVSALKVCVEYDSLLSCGGHFELTSLKTCSSTSKEYFKSFNKICPVVH